MNIMYQIILLLVITLNLAACSREPKLTDAKLVAVEAQAFSNPLFYTGTIQPLKTMVVPSPADGVVVEMPFQYGEPVKSGQLLFMLSSTKFLSDYKAALMQYIKAKSEFNTSESQLKEAEFLHKNLLISDDDYKMKKSNFYGGQLALLQAKDSLENLLHQLDVKDVNLYSLTIADIDKITQAMHLQKNSENIRILSNANGIVLSANKNEEETKKLTKGEIVKQGDVLAIIGDMSGLSVHIKVNELTVNQLKVGQHVKVTGIAFPEHVLQGSISRVDRQGEASSGGLPNFSVEIIVSKLSKQQQNEIHVGMSAKVEIDINENQQIMIPIKSISEKNSESFVKVYDESAGKLKNQLVKTGKTTMDSVAILSGLKQGDRIVIPN